LSFRTLSEVEGEESAFASAFDRLLGYGLKYPTYFKDTHLQHIPTVSDATA